MSERDFLLGKASEVEAHAMRAAPNSEERKIWTDMLLEIRRFLAALDQDKLPLQPIRTNL